MNNFEQKVLQGLSRCGVQISSEKTPALGVAVSGGADSLSLLVALCNLGFPLHVITVNHYIRSDEETCADAQFVVDFCARLGEQGGQVDCVRVDLVKGSVQKLEKERGCGIEEAARILRYNEFEKFIAQNNLNFLCLAHNQNDQVETLVMRFLQGSAGPAALGIQSSREHYIRPMLDISRSEIEAYLTQKNISWRTDSTNFDTNYLRNKIRHKIIPVLNEEIPGWQKAVLTGAEKQKEQTGIVQNLIDELELSKTSDDSVCAVASDFFNFSKALQIQILLKMCNQICDNFRIPFAFLNDVIEAFNNKTQCTKRFANLEISFKNNSINVKKRVKTQTDLCFFDIINIEDKYDFPFGTIEFISDKNKLCSVLINGSDTGTKVKLPVCVRNARIGDSVLDGEGKQRKLVDIFSAWKVPEDLRSYVPLLQDLDKTQQIKCIFGCAVGFNNWIVKE